MIPIERYDLTVVADFTQHSDDCWRIAEEVRSARAAGYAIALVNTGSPRAKVHADIAACLFESLAVPAAIENWIETKLLIIATPQAVAADRLERRPHIRSRTALAVVGDWPEPHRDLRQIDANLRFLFGDHLLWTATTAAVRAQLASSVHTAPEPWAPVLQLGPALTKPVPGAVIGTIVMGDAGEPLAIEGHKVLTLARTRQRNGFACDEITLAKFLAKIDVLACYDTGDTPPVTAIGKALQQRMPVLLPPELKPLFGAGPIYAPRAELPQRLARIRKDRSRSASSKAMAQSSVFRSETEFIGGLMRLIGPAAKRGPRRAQRRRVFLISSNGVGLGHLTRLLSVARRLGPEFEPVFITFSQGASVLSQFGYAFQYLPSQTHAGIDYATWNAWLRTELGEMLAAQEPAALIYDGNNPYPGMLQAAGHLQHCRMCWIRRGMWRATHDPNFLDGGRFFDLVIEPEDIAATLDRGATAVLRDEALSVPPMRLLEDEEVLDRNQARAELGLALDRPAALIQLGSGGTRDVTYLIDVVVDAMARVPELQICVAEWLVGTERLKLWRSVKLIRGFPIGRYVNAFDFTIAAAGYNTFNEIMSYGLPAIFVPNEHSSMDDQGARAAFAEVNGAGFHLPEGQVREIGGLIQSLLDPTTRALIRLNALRIAKPNGAPAAAAAIESLAGHG